MNSFCDHYTNVVHIYKEFLAEKNINVISLSRADKEIIIKINYEKIYNDSETLEIIYPPINNLQSDIIKITYFTEENEILCIDELRCKPWSLHMESKNCRTIVGSIVKNIDFVIRPIELAIAGSTVPYKTELARKEIRNDGLELNIFSWHLQKDHDGTDIIEAYIDNQGCYSRIKYLARPDGFALQAELTAKNKVKKITNLGAEYKIAIVMPIYNGVEETIMAIDSILTYYGREQRHSDIRIRLILGLDNPSNISMREKIDAKYSCNPIISILVNENNLGFIQNCNKMFATVEKDEEVVLINSDVICPKRDWILKLINISNLSDEIGTVTPMSNCASIFSFPSPNTDNDCILPEHLELVNDALNTKVNNILMVPSCHGFCVLIRKTRLPFELKLDPIFGKGYGEENDLSLKISKSGLKNVACPSVFIYHHESISFSGDKKPLLKRNLKILGQRYPTYHADVQNWIAKDLLKKYRNNAIKQLIAPHINGKKVFLHISHSRGGGTLEYINQKINENQKFIHILISSSQEKSKCCTLSLLNTKDENLVSQLYLQFNEVEIIHEFHWLESVCIIEKIILHSLIDFASPCITLGFAQNLNYTKEIMIHDYEWISPNQNLIDKNIKLIPVKQSELIYSLDRIDNRYLLSESLNQHRNNRNHFLSSDYKIICPSNAARELMAECYPNMNNICTKYHDSSGDIQQTTIEQSLDKFKSDKIKLAVIGAIGPNKGYELLCEIARNVFTHKNPIKIIVFGYTINDDKLTTINPNVTITGKYKGNGEFEDLLKVHKPNSSLFLSPWPETYSYTLSLAFIYKLWPFVLNYGAISERVLQSKFGQVLTSNDPKEIIDQIESIRT
ncbi:MAG: hypothetical protein CL532_00035 [Aestuariivita sp.]|nr:hypothetical protein [Aestuariivita sp.]